MLNPLTKYAAIASISASALISGFHYGSHGWLYVENATKTQWNTFIDKGASLLLTYTGRSQPVATNTISLNQLIDREARARGINPILIESMIEVESNWRSDAIRFEPSLYDGSGDQGRMKASSHGYMQILGSWAGRTPCTNVKNWADLYDPIKNIQCGTAILALALQNQKSVLNSLIEYNGGAKCKLSPKCLDQASSHARKVMVSIAERMILTQH